MPGLVAMLLMSISVFFAHTAGATLGAAEWQERTPGGNRIVHLDPLAPRFGTCLVGGPGTDGKPLEDADVIVAHIQWWQYYKTYVIGETDSGVFLFDEISRAVDFYSTAEAARTHARQRSGSGPLGPERRGVGRHTHIIKSLALIGCTSIRGIGAECLSKRAS
jgi:hypothetical protein